MNFPMPVTLLVAPEPSPPVPHEPAPPQALNLIHAVMETLMGRRPLHQLRPHLSWAAFASLADHVDSGTFKRIRVGRVRSQMPTAQAVEASVTIATRGRSVSCVLRLDAGRSSWRCSELTILMPHGMAQGAPKAARAA